MALSDYDSFCNNPSTLKERFPTIEEFALAFDDFFVLKKSVNRTDYETLCSAVRDGKKNSEHKKINDRNSIKKYLECFDLGSFSESVDEILDNYVENINDSTVSGSSVNYYIRYWFRPIFAKAYGIRPSTTNWRWLGNIPASEEGDDFFTYLSCLNEKEIEENLKDDNNKKNFKNWITDKRQSKNFGKIKSVLAFLEDVNSDRLIVNKENLLISWFYTKCYKHFPCDESLVEKYGPKGNEVESPFTNRINNLVTLIDGPKEVDSKEKIEAELAFLQANAPVSDYPVLLYEVFMHNLFQRNYEESIRYAKIVSDIFFYVGATGNLPFRELRSQWFRMLVVAAAYISYKATDSKTQTAATKLFTSLLKRSYLVVLKLDVIDYDDSLNFEFDNSEKLNDLRQRYNAYFISYFMPSSFYEKEKQLLELTYDEAKINQKTIFFGNVSGYAIEIAARINNPQKVEEIIAKGGNVLKSKNGFQNALYWSICNMLQFIPIGFWRFEIVPHSTEHIMEEEILSFIIPKGKKTLKKYYDYNKVHAEELNNAYKIFKMILPMYKDSGYNVSVMKFFDNKNFFFTICSIGQYSILEDAMPLVNIEELKKDSENYFLAVLQTYNQLWACRNGCRRKFEFADSFNQYLKSPIFEGYEQRREESFFYKDVLMQEEFLFDSHCSFINENELLKIIDKLIELHFDPCKDIPQKPHDFPYGVIPLYDCTLFAIEMGWLKCIKRLCTYIIAEYNDHWEKMKKSYFAEAMWQWQMRNQQCIRYPSETEQKLILKFLAPLMK